MDITLYGLGPTRSARVLWTLRELGLDFEYVEGRHLIGSDELKEVHPMGKLPAVLLDGRPLFESVAICTHLCDLHPEKELIAAPGTWKRAMHEQWSAFVLSELEAWLWVSARHTFVYPEDERIPEIMPINAREARAALAVLEQALGDYDHLVGDHFTVTDIIVSYAVNWARRVDLLDGFPHLAEWLERLRDREACPLPD